ncbi:hypothetical protein FIBSPDRAFT_924732 [Athelia psychrophila]|uniref:Uncharacterized protein n=1 Tax=Athelia psychrophila TaxID=1759441 RepID=A0A166VYW9_9AGAM|nr:hypothetical protein FIBSPDRAFT_924732 [Fibularhizoctonia sp. CBS 109695]
MAISGTVLGKVPVDSRRGHPIRRGLRMWSKAADRFYAKPSVTVSSVDAPQSKGGLEGGYTGSGIREFRVVVESQTPSGSGQDARHCAGEGQETVSGKVLNNETANRSHLQMAPRFYPLPRHRTEPRNLQSMLQSFSQFLPASLQLSDPHARTATPALEENRQLGLGHPTSPLSKDVNAPGAAHEASELRKKVKKEKPANEANSVFTAMRVIRAKRAIPPAISASQPENHPFREVGDGGAGGNIPSLGEDASELVLFASQLASILLRELASYISASLRSPPRACELLNCLPSLRASPFPSRALLSRLCDLSSRSRDLFLPSIPNYTTFIFVRPPPAKNNHPLNLQVQLVPPTSKDKVRSRGPSDASSRPTSSAGDDGAETGSNLARTQSAQSSQSAYSQNTTSSNASISSYASSNTSGRRMIIPLYNLQAHNVMTNTVVDAGTDAKVAKFKGRGVEIIGLACLEPVEVWGDALALPGAPMTPTAPGASAVENTPALRPPILGITPTFASPASPPVGRPNKYVWVVKRWLKVVKGGEGLNLNLMALGGKVGSRLAGKDSPPNGITALVEVRFEWSRGRTGARRKARPRRGDSVGSGDRDRDRLSPEKGAGAGDNPNNRFSMVSHTTSSDSHTPPAETDDGDESDPEDSETPWTCALAVTRIPAPAPSTSSFGSAASSLAAPAPPSPPADPGIRIKVATLSPTPHHPKVVSMLKVPYPLPDIEVERVVVRRRAGVSAHNGAGLVLTAEEIKDVISCTGLWLVVREGFGGVGRVGRKGDGWRLRA